MRLLFSIRRLSALENCNGTLYAVWFNDLGLFLPVFISRWGHVRVDALAGALAYETKSVVETVGIRPLIIALFGIVMS